MPNHVSQDLWVRGPLKDLEEFKEFAKEERHGNDLLLSANKFIPYPDKYQTADDRADAARKKGDYSVKDGYNAGGYQWCIQNWGTKWGIYGCSLVRENKTSKNKGYVRYYFESAWSPATKIIHAMSEKFPTLHFKLKYYECGMQFKGTYEVSAGVICADETSSYTGNRGG